MQKSKLPDVYTLVGLLEEYTMTEIGAMYGVSSSRVSQYLRQRGVSASHRLRSRTRKNDTIQAVTALAQQGMSLRRIGQEVDLCSRTVKRILQRNGVEFRPFGNKEERGNLTEGVNLKITPELKQAICQRADEHNTTVSNMIRQLLAREFLPESLNPIRSKDDQKPSQG